jgi:hypothetical protein
MNKNNLGPPENILNISCLIIVVLLKIVKDVNFIYNEV